MSFDSQQEDAVESTGPRSESMDAGLEGAPAHFGRRWERNGRNVRCEDQNCRRKRPRIRATKQVISCLRCVRSMRRALGTVQNHLVEKSGFVFAHLGGACSSAVGS